MKNFFIVLVIFGAASFLFLPTTGQAKVPTPQIYNLVDSSENSYRPWVTGWTPNGVEVEVFMDGKSQGFAKVVPNKSGTASFGWSPLADLPVGFHEFRIRGKFANEYSEAGGIIGYWVKHPVPAPTLVDSEIHEDFVLIRGLVRNDSSVKIYIDEIMVADFLVPNHPSGTTNFWFKARGVLNGVHEVYAVAYDNSGRLSKSSNVNNFKTEFQQITKGEEDNQLIGVNDDKNMDKVVDQPVVGSVNVESGNQAAGQVIVKETTEDDSQVVVGEVENEGKISSDQEVASQEEDTGATIGVDKLKSNRLVGLGLMGVAVVLLFIWYWREKNKPKDPNNIDLE